MTKVAVIGCTHAGTFATSSILQHYPDCEVHVFERNDTLSFLSCGIALWVGNHVSSPDRMFYSSPEALAELGAHMHMCHDVTACDVKAKTLRAQNLKTGESFDYAFDKLVITTGSLPCIPAIEGLDEALENQTVLLCKNWQHALALKERVKTVHSVVVVGAGYIGAELAEQLSDLGVHVTLVDAFPHVLNSNFDDEICTQVEDAMREHGVQLALNQKVVAFKHEDTGVSVVTQQGEWHADIAILGVGFKPNTQMFVDEFEHLANGALIVDDYMHVTYANGELAHDVFAAGDSATVHYNPTDKPGYIPLATNAVRQGLLVGENLFENTHAYAGTQSTSAVQLYDLSMSATGMTYKAALKQGFDAGYVTVTEDYRPNFMLETTPVTSVLVWDKSDGRILGGQFISKHDISLAANVVSLAVQSGYTLQQLFDSDLFFQPNFCQPINFITSVALAALQSE